MLERNLWWCFHIPIFFQLYFINLQWEDFLSISEYESDRKIEQMMISLMPTHCCSVIYTVRHTAILVCFDVNEFCG